MSITDIQAHTKSIKILFSGKYAVDWYQREYKWVDKQIEDLVNDLISAFVGNYRDGHQRVDVKQYGQYFLGPIIVSASKEKSGDTHYIVDGQQRLITLTLALICLLRLVINETGNADQESTLRNLICSAPFGEPSFNLSVPDHAECLKSLYDGESCNTDGKSESVRNLVARYEQLKNTLDNSLPEEKIPIPLFVDWLIEKVYLVELTTSSIEDAYKIFETMNDRGLRLTPAEMLKSYLLSEIRDNEMRDNANEAWKKQIDQLTEPKGEDADAIKSWLRARHAAIPDDFEKIGSQFHRWVRDNSATIELKASTDFRDFIERDFVFYAKNYGKLRRMAEKYDATNGLECIHYLAQHSFTLQYPLLLASLAPNDSASAINCKLRVVAAYLDILVHRRIGNWRMVAESTMRNYIFGLIPKIRDKSAHELAELLAKKLEQDGSPETLAADFALHGNNRPRIHRILARITDYVETQSAATSNYAGYFVSGKAAFQIEHIWHDNYVDVRKEESMSETDLSAADFETMRNYIGGLLLLPQKNNKSYGALSYKKKKHDYYQTQNLLAGSLHENSYASKPGFSQFKQKSGLPFEDHPKFQKIDLEKRQDLYRQIADRIWHPNRLHEAASAN